MSITIFGPDYSTYTRSARIVCAEKNITYTLHPVHIMGGENHSPEHRARHPMGKVPTLQHDDFHLYETPAILRYLDEEFGEPSLQPKDIVQRARMTQIISISDGYLYEPAVLKIFVQRTINPIMGETVDEAVIASALPLAEQALRAIEEVEAEDHGPFLTGDAFSLADAHLMPIIDYFIATPEGQNAMAVLPRLTTWWEAVRTRPSLVSTAPKLG